MSFATIIIATYGAFGLISVGISLYAWQRRDVVRGASYFALAILLEATWTFGYILESLSSSLAGKIFWDNFQFIGYLYSPALFVLFTITYLSHPEHQVKLWRWLLLGTASLFMLIVASNPLHGLIRYDAFLINAETYDILSYTVTTTLYLTAIYAYLCMFTVIYLVLRAAWKARKGHWQPFTVIAVGASLPLIAGTFTLSGLNLWGERDIMPLAFSISNLFWVWGVFRYHLMDVMPIAREKVFLHSEDAIFVMDLQQNIVDINPRAWAYTGREAQPIGRPFAEIFPQWVALSQRQSDHTRQKFIIPTPIAGDTHHCQLVFSTLTDEVGTKVGTMLTVRDLTDIIETQRALQHQTKNMQLMIDVSRKITTLLDLDQLLPEIARITQQTFTLYHVLIFLHDPEEAVLRYAVDYGFGKPDLAADFSIDLDSDIGLIAAAARSRQSIIDHIDSAAPSYYVTGLDEAKSELVIPMVLGDEIIGVLVLLARNVNHFQSDDVRLLENLGEQIAIAVNNSRVVNKWQQVQLETVLLFNIGQDLNSISSFEGIVQTLEKHLDTDDLSIRLALNNTFDHRTANHVEEVAITKIEGYDLPQRTYPMGLLGEIPPRSTILAQTLDDNDIPHVRELMAEAGMQSLLLTQLRVQERRLGVLFFVSPTKNRFTKSHRRILGSITDAIAATAERIRLFNEQVNIAEQLRTIDDTKSQFLASMSHELRTPLNAILNFNKIILKEKLGPLTERQRDLISKSLSSGEHLLALINDVLDITKVEANMLELFIETDVDLYAEIEATVSAIEPILNDKPDVRLVLDIDPNLPTMTVDRRRLRQIMMNLLSNAAKFTEEGSITFSAKSRSDGCLLLAVIDTGPGIEFDQQEAIFDPFVQSTAGKQHLSGTGLGLPISRQLVEAHGGKLWLESEPGDGAAFFVKMPVHHEALVLSIDGA